TLAHLGHRVALAALAEPHDLAAGVAYEVDVRGSARHRREDEGALGVVQGVCGQRGDRLRVDGNLVAPGDPDARGPESPDALARDENGVEHTGGLHLDVIL